MKRVRNRKKKKKCNIVACMQSVRGAIIFLIFYKRIEEDKADMYGLPCAIGLLFVAAHLRFPSADGLDF